MALTLRQKREALYRLRVARDEIQALKERWAWVAELRERYGEEVVAYLAPILSVAEWTQVNATLGQWLTLMDTRMAEAEGNGLDELRQPAPPEEGQ